MIFWYNKYLIFLKVIKCIYYEGNVFLGSIVFRERNDNRMRGNVDEVVMMLYVRYLKVLD